MATIGINEQLIDLFDRDLAFRRIKSDIKSDFIPAPHLDLIYEKGSEELYNELTKELKNGGFSPNLPITIESIKPSGFSRPGSILLPFERLAYQLFIDVISPEAEKEIDREKVFSNVLNPPEEEFMFQNPGESYSNFKERVQYIASSNKYEYVLKADVSSFFERLYQHVLINNLRSTTAEPNILTALEKLLSEFTQKDSHGIIQGVCPSDFLGNFYLCSIDAEHELINLDYVRYVDDIYIFFERYSDAIHHRIRLSSWLRRDGLNLNENKSQIIKIEDLIYEESEVDMLFDDAKSEIDEVLGEIYGQEIRVSTLIDYEEFETKALKHLFDQYSVSDKTRTKIDNFCIPIFGLVKDDHAVDYVLASFHERPHMAPIYAKYISEMLLVKPQLRKKIEKLIEKDYQWFDYQKMWMYYSLIQAQELDNKTVQFICRDLKDFKLNIGLRAICAILIGKFGNASQRRLLKNHYSEEPSNYVKNSILYATQFFSKDEKNTCFRAWGGHDKISSLIVASLKS